MPKKRSLIIILVILAITIGHFVTQISFIESENKRIVESLAKSEPTIEINKTEETDSKAEVAETKQADEILSVQPNDSSKEAKPVKVVQKDPRRQVETESLQNTSRKEEKSKSRAERLRRAEKILTGF